MKTYNRQAAIFPRTLPRDWKLDPEKKESPLLLTVVFVAFVLTALAACWVLF